MSIPRTLLIHLLSAVYCLKLYENFINQLNSLFFYCVGASLDANVALVLNNAKVASLIACEHAEILRTSSSSSSFFSYPSSLSYPSSFSSSSSSSSILSPPALSSSTSSSHNPSVHSPSSEHSSAPSLAPSSAPSLEHSLAPTSIPSVLVFGASIMDVIASSSSHPSPHISEEQPKGKNN